MNKFFRYFFIGIILPLLVQYVVYFQFTPNYTQDLFSEKSFVNFYGKSVYQSRQLGKQIHLWVYHKIAATKKMQEIKSNPYNSRRLLHLDAQADPVFYLTYFFLACVFTVLFSLVLLLLLDDKLLVAGWSNDVIVCLLVVLIGLTQFVVTPYDNPGYFFQAVGMLTFLKYYKTGRSLYYLLLLFIIVLATINRETSLLLLSFMAAIYYCVHGIKWQWIKKMVLPVLCFVTPYLLLKLATAKGATFTDSSQLLLNLNLFNFYTLAGLAFAAFAFYFVLTTSNPQKTPLAKAFLVFSLPYIIIIPTVGLMVEYRLWIPIIIGGVVLSALNFTSLKRQQNEKLGNSKEVYETETTG